MPRQPTLAILLLASSSAVSGCGSPSGAGSAPAGGGDRPATAVERPWTEKFRAPATLVAREIRVEGPSGLVSHVAFQQHPDHVYEAKATADGFLQSVVCKRAEGELIRLQLDNLAIAAEASVRVLERVGEVPVRIVATGDVYWKNLETGEELRTDSLELTGERPK